MKWARPKARLRSVCHSHVRLWRKGLELSKLMGKYNRIPVAPDGFSRYSVALENRQQSLIKAPLISIVDDETSMCEAVSSLIRSVGFRARTFASTEEFVQCDQLGEISCLILDVRLPGMSGLELLRHLSITTHRIPIVFISGHADEATRKQALDAGAIEFLYKPFNEESLLKAIDSALKHQLT
jgi:CheY-like chemotaxis protein